MASVFFSGETPSLFILKLIENLSGTKTMLLKICVRDLEREIKNAFVSLSPKLNENVSLPVFLI